MTMQAVHSLRHAGIQALEAMRSMIHDLELLHKFVWHIMKGLVNTLDMFGRMTGLFACRLLPVVFVLACAGCGDQSAVKNPQKEMLVYCGITMVQPVQEIALDFEKQNKCIVKIIKGGSGDLLKAIERSQKGDLYLPGEASYMDACISDGVCRSSVCVGYNWSVMVVRKGNPKNIPPELKSMTNRSYKVVIADPDTGSIGREAKSVLEKADLFNEVIANNPIFTTDSKDISKAIQNGHADLGINWYATTQWPENVPHIDALAIPEHYAPKTPLLLGLLSCSADSNLAREFMKNAVSPEGKEIFKKFGFEPSL